MYILWRVGCLPLIISISPSLNRRPSPGSRREWVCERGGALKTSRSGGVWWGTPEVNGASSPPVICRVRLSSGDRSLPRACTLVSSWVQEGSVEGASAAPVTRLTGQDAGPYNPRRCRGLKEDEAARRSRRTSRSGPERGACAAAGLRPLPGPFLPEHCPSFTTRAARRGHQIPCLFWTLHPLWTLFYYLFNKSLSEAWRHTHCVCRLLLPPQYIRKFFFLLSK